jgi:hypothetical protein
MYCVVVLVAVVVFNPQCNAQSTPHDRKLTPSVMSHAVHEVHAPG